MPAGAAVVPAEHATVMRIVIAAVIVEIPVIANLPEHAVQATRMRAYPHDHYASV
jgi:hypothetical protein